MKVKKKSFENTGKSEFVNGYSYDRLNLHL